MVLRTNRFCKEGSKDGTVKSDAAVIATVTTKSFLCNMRFGNTNFFIKRVSSDKYARETLFEVSINSKSYKLYSLRLVASYLISPDASNHNL